MAELQQYLEQLRSIRENTRDENVLKANIKQFDVEEDQRLRNITLGYAVQAVEYYNRCNNCDLGLIEPLSSVRFCDPAGTTNLWAHIIFTAKEKNCSCALTEIYFAELCLDVCQISLCVNLKNMTDDGPPNSGRTLTCAVCREVCPMLHPKSGFTAGLNGGTFTDAQVKRLSFGMKVELQPKIGTSSEANRVQDDQLVDDMCSP